MKKAIKTTIVLTLLLTSQALFAAPLSHNEAKQLIIEAERAYDSGNFEQAVTSYSAILDEGYEQWELYYNLGNCYYRMEELGLCILNYERALRLAGNKKDIKDNLALANSKTTDNIEVLPEMFLWRWFNSFVNMASPRGWRVICIVLTILLCVTASMFFIAENYMTRKHSFMIAATMTILLLLSIVGLIASCHNVKKDNEAIVTSPLVVVKGGPDVKSMDKFVIHEGAKLKIGEEQDEWWHIELGDGKEGWINGGAERI